MTVPAAVVVNPSLYLIVEIVLVSVIIGAVDLLRRPNWAWSAAGEPKLVSLLMVLFLPGVGLAIYVFATRPKLVEITAAGRAANLPFERFGDQATLVTRHGRHIQALPMPAALGSFGERRPVRTIRASGPELGPSGGGSFFDDPDVVTVGAPAGTVDPAPVATDATQPGFHIPGSLGRPYHPRQRASLKEGESLASVAAQIFGAADGTEPVRPVAPVASAPPSLGAPPAPQGSAPVLDPVPAAQVAGPSFAAHAAAHGASHRHGAVRSGALPLIVTPSRSPGRPSSWYPRPTRPPRSSAAPRWPRRQ
jgi:hypothetical protein